VSEVCLCFGRASPQVEAVRPAAQIEHRGHPESPATFCAKRTVVDVGRSEGHVADQLRTLIHSHVRAPDSAFIH
jgi:hypothetical protein